MIQKVFSLTLMFVMAAFIGSYGQEMTALPKHCIKMQKQCSKVASQSSAVTVSLPSVPDRGTLTVGDESARSTNCKPTDCDPRQCEPANCLPENCDPGQCKAKVCPTNGGKASAVSNTTIVKPNTCQKMVPKENRVKI